MLGEFQCVLNDVNSIKLLALGDYNADPTRARICPLLHDFAAENNLTFDDLSLSIDSFTCLSPANNTTSWLNHVFSS